MKLSKALLSRRDEFRISKRSIALLKSAGVSKIWTNGHGYASTLLNGKYVTIHRLLMELMGHEICGLEVDHKNRNRLDNRISNLRMATRTGNRANTEKTRRNTSGFKGVDFRKRAGKWRARIGGYTQDHLGYFDCPIKAARAYNAAAKKRYGKFAKLNAC